MAKMSGWGTRFGTLAALAALAVPLSAQAPPRPVDRAQLRHQIYVMEGALARAVEFGAQSLNREMRSVMPDVFMLAGDAQARGVYLEGYGIYFDVQVPIMRQSMMWSLRTMLERDEAGVKSAIDQLRQLTQNPALDARTRASAEAALKRLELQLGPIPPPQAAPGNPFGASLGQPVASGQQTDALAPAPATPPLAVDVPPSALPVEKGWVQDPNKAYTEAVQRAIIDAMIDYSMPMRIGVDESLTVAARDNEPRDTLAPPNPLEETVTLLYQIKGADLAAYRSGAIDRDEARRRVVIREF